MSRWRPALIVGLCLAVLTATGYLILTWPGSADGAPLVLDRPGTVMSGQTVARRIEIAADNVTLRQLTVKAGGAAVIRVRPGATGTTVEDSEIHCATRVTDGIVPGHYSALRVRTFGCRHSFTHSPDAPASIVDSTQDGQPYQAGGSPDPSDRHPHVAPPPPGTSITYWPGPTTTGVPAGTRLTNSGPLTLRKNGQVISNVHITGCVSVYARNVTIRRSKITCDSPTFAVRTFETARDLVIEDVEIDGGGHDSTAVCCGDYTLRRVNIHHTSDGPRLGANSTVVDSWVHDLTRAPGSHNDTLQTTAGSTILVRHNRLDAYRPSVGDPMNACLMIGSTSGPAVSDLLVEDNYCNGGNYSIGLRADLTASKIRFRGNRFGRDYRYGIIARPRHVGIVWESSNVWLDNGQPVHVMAASPHS